METSIREYAENLVVKIEEDKKANRLIIKAYNEGGIIVRQWTY